MDCRNTLPKQVSVTCKIYLNL